MPRPKGTPKTGGRKKGSPTKKSTILTDFRSRLEANEVDLEEVLAGAILRGDVDMIKALTALVPFLTPRMKEAEPGKLGDTPPAPPAPGQAPSSGQPARPNLTGVSNAQLLSLLKKSNVS